MQTETPSESNRASPRPATNTVDFDSCNCNWWTSREGTMWT